MELIKTITALLSLVTIVSTSIIAGTVAKLHRDHSPLSHTYVNELLFHFRKVVPKARVLSSNIIPFLTRFSVMPFAFDGVVLYPWVGLNAGLDMRGVPFFHSFIKDSLRGNVIMGSFYKHPSYLRIGYDFIPIGYHLFDVGASRGCVTRCILDEKHMLLELGSSYLGLQGQLQGSITFCINHQYPIAILSAQYETKKLMQGSRFLTIERYKIGSGIGSMMPYRRQKMLFNFYNHIDFLKAYNLRFEYVYNALFEQIQSCNEMEDILKVDPRSFHIECSRYFDRIPVGVGHVSFSLLCGYENGAYSSFTFRKKIFGAFKSEIFNGHILCVSGVEWDCINSKLNSLLRLKICF